MLNYVIAAEKLPDLARAPSVGEQVNVHVVEYVAEAVPDFAQMNDTIRGERAAAEPAESENGEVAG
jgi:hypothetical protein